MGSTFSRDFWSQAVAGDNDQIVISLFDNNPPQTYSHDGECLYEPSLSLPVVSRHLLRHTCLLAPFGFATGTYRTYCIARVVDVPGRGAFGWEAQAVFIPTETGLPGIEIHTKSLQTLAVRMLKFSHRNLARYYAVGRVERISDRRNTSFDGTSLCVLMEPWLTPNQTETSLYDLSRDTELTANQITTYALQLLAALEYLHNQDHRYVIAVLRSTAIMVSSDRGSLKIVDWLNPLYYVQTVHGGKLIMHCRDFMHPILINFGCVVLDMLTQGHIQHVNKDGIVLDKRLAYPAWLGAMRDGGPRSSPTVQPTFCVFFVGSASRKTHNTSRVPCSW
ncbi:hypothetical protein BV898_13173 [Hypsibius exemplaris]|uniref:Protein kinase domain-containing protein n=1 Tax=Hypsibius exemplaris TaxID=2072580 RepID=A0A1W0WBD9_HYPEX|nr:hypothetical protein BV898_13173 [Hypsibius exemplaris]